MTFWDMNIAALIVFALLTIAFALVHIAFGRKSSKSHN